MDLTAPHIFAPLIARAESAPEALFATLIVGGVTTQVTIGDVLADAAAIRDRLLHAGLSAGDLVIVVLPTSRQQYAAFIGCALAGLVPSFLPPLTFKQDPAYYARAMAALFGRIRPAAVITNGAAGATVPSGGYPVIDADGVAGPRTVSLAGLPPGGERIAFLQHTSGTTAHKKGVMLSHAHVLAQAQTYAAAIGLEPGDPIASWLPLYHDMGLLTAFIIPAIIGCPIVALDAQEWVTRPDMLLDAIQAFRARYVWLPNFAFQHLARAAGARADWDLASVKQWTNCSEVCRPAAFEMFLQRFGPCGVDETALGTCYAMAETVFALTQSPPGRRPCPGTRPQTTATLSSGRPLPGVELSIRDPDGQPADGLGEIWVRAPFLFSGYFRMPDVTAARFQDDWFRTGDLGGLEHGELFVIGRTDDLLNIAGRNIVAHDVEDEVGLLPGIAPGRVLAFAAHDPASGTARMTVLAERAGAGEDDAALLSAIRQTVHAATGTTPATVRLLPRGFLLKSTSGKLARADSIEKFRVFDTSLRNS